MINNILSVNLKLELDKIKKFIDKLILITHKNLRFNILIEENFPEAINLDLKFIEMMLIYLITNAIKFSNAGKIILKVFYNKDLNKISFNISDEGIGIKEEYLELIGTLMFKINNRNNEYGLGMGIYHVKLIIEALSGNLLISSKPGQGTNVYVDFKTFEKVNKNEEFNRDNSFSEITKKFCNNIFFDYDKNINNNLLKHKSLEKIKNDNQFFGSESLNNNEIKQLIERMSRTKTTRENIKKKFKELTDTVIECCKTPGIKYKILINSTNNVNKFTDFNKKSYELSHVKYNLDNKNSSSYLSDKNLMRNNNNNLGSNFRNNTMNTNNSEFIIKNSSNKNLITKTTLFSFESNLDNILCKKTVSNSIKLNKCNNNQNNYIGKAKNNANYSMIDDTETKNISIKSSYGRNSRTFYSENEINKICLYNKERDDFDYKKKSKQQTIST